MCQMADKLCPDEVLPLAAAALTPNFCNFCYNCPIDMIFVSCESSLAVDAVYDIKTTLPTM